MIIGRLIGALLLLAALVVLGRDLIAWYDTGHLAPIVSGQLWFQLHRGSLNLVQAVIQRYVAVWLWDPVIATILLWPAVLVLAVPGIALSWLCRSRENTRRPRRRR